jgi:NADH-quinone oxidoreductase subunit M
VNSGAASFDLIGLRAAFRDAVTDPSWGGTTFGLLLFGFGILVSLFPLHTWAPRAYGAAPTGAAMLHAGVLKKFGLYGLIQIAAPLLPSAAVGWQPWIIVLALGNVLIIGLITVAQRDVKQVVAYSSVMHMGYAFLGVATLSTVGIGGAVLMLVAHGLSVSLLFLLTTTIHHRTGTFYIPAMGGLMKTAPALAFFFAAATFASIGLPGLANFWGELAIFVSLWEFNGWIAFLAAIGIVLSAIYGLRAFTGIFLGEAPKEAPDGPQVRQGDLSWSERLPALVLLGALLLVGIWPRSLSEPINRSLPEPVTSVATLPATELPTYADHGR